MEIRNLLADISRDFFKMKEVSKYRMKKVSDMTDEEVISSCHSYCEENRLTDEWYGFREKIESEYQYCRYLSEYIEEGLCCDLQMIAGGLIKPSALPEITVDREKCTECCSECRYSL